MVEIFHRQQDLIIKNSDGKCITIRYDEKQVVLDGMVVDFPWEYEKAGVLLEVKEYKEALYYSFMIEGNVIFVLFDEAFDPSEEILSFLGDIDVLILHANKNSQKTIENIESRVIIPVGEYKEMFLHSVWQNKDQIDTYKIKADLPNDATEFVNLA